MVKRPVFIHSTTPTNRVHEVNVEFRWHSGFSPSQKIKNRDALHQAARELGIEPILEVSSKSNLPIGQKLSAFNLLVAVPDHGEIPVESAFQGSKIFKGCGSCHDLYDLPPREAKRMARERDKSDLEGFNFAGEPWALHPKTCFYDWLYLSAIARLPRSDWGELSSFAGFTDIEFNPARSINCQARSCALAVSLILSGKLGSATASRENYAREILDADETRPDVKSTFVRQLDML